MVDSAALSATLEDYLEAISRLVAEKGAARAGDIANALSVHKSTVTSALKGLARKGYVNYSPYAFATLTPEGQEKARDIRRRHEVIRGFLQDVLSVDSDVAEANACRMEHVMDREVLKRLSKFAEFARECPRAGDDWLGRFEYYFEHGGRPPRDKAALERFLANFKENLSEPEDKGRDKPG